MEQWVSFLHQPVYMGTCLGHNPHVSDKQYFMLLFDNSDVNAIALALPGLTCFPVTAKR
jgi:hypothetical protein